MAIVEGWFPPSRQNWQTLCFLFQFFPLFTIAQWILNQYPKWALKYYPMGKTSQPSRFNVPGKLGWATMEAPGFITLLYIMYTLPQQEGIESLPWPNWTMAALFSIHYVYRALLCPILNPSMSPIHVLVWASALSFQLVNGTCIGGWLAGYGPRTWADWEADSWPLSPRLVSSRIEVGMMIWAVFLLLNMFHDDELREIRRAAARKQKQRETEKDEKGKGEGKGVDKVYMIPKNGLFAFILYPHYFCEWIEWAAFWMIGGLGCIPARSFVVNEVTTMLPRALQGKKWYVERFGEEKIQGKKAVIPGIL